VRAFAFAVALAWFTGPFGFAEQPAKKDLPKALPAAIVKAWKDAGATVGWMKVDDSGVLKFNDEPEAGAVPAFKFAHWKAGILPKLPLPETPFGIDLSKTELMDAGLKEFANLRTLTSLCLCETQVMAETVEMLRKTLPKCFIFHC